MAKQIGAPVGPRATKVPLKVDISSKSNPTVQEQQNGKKKGGK